MPLLLLACLLGWAPAVASTSTPASRCEPAFNPGYTVQVVERALGPGGGAVLSKANGTSGFNYSMNAAYFPASSAPGAVDGLVVRVGNQARYGPTGLAVVRRIGGNSSMHFEFVDDTKLVVPCPTINNTHADHTPSAPCADDPRIAYRALDQKYWMTYGNDSGLDKSMSGRVQWVASSKTPWVSSSW